MSTKPGMRARPVASRTSRASSFDRSAAGARLFEILARRPLGRRVARIDVALRELPAVLPLGLDEAHRAAAKEGAARRVVVFDRELHACSLSARPPFSHRMRMGDYDVL